MTAQISDTFIFKGEEYSLIGIEGSGLNLPLVFGMIPEEMSTACYRGYYATYELTEKAMLYLREMTLRARGGEYLPIEGVMPDEKGNKKTENSLYLDDIMSRTYRDLDVRVMFSGRIRLATGFIQDLYIHMGFQKASSFKTVYDITLKYGKIFEIKDRSKDMEQKRGAFKKHYEAGDIAQTTIDAFKMDMDQE